MKNGNEMTNGDKIRSMDDEGLTQFFLKRQCKCCPVRDICLENRDMSCHDKILQWLKQDYSGSKWLEHEE